MQVSAFYSRSEGIYKPFGKGALRLGLSAGFQLIVENFHSLGFTTSLHGNGNPGGKIKKGWRRL
jgi:hypothetical protein